MVRVSWGAVLFAGEASGKNGRLWRRGKGRREGRGFIRVLGGVWAAAGGRMAGGSGKVVKGLAVGSEVRVGVSGRC
jgi:hypothetical protein